MIDFDTLFGWIGQPSNFHGQPREYTLNKLGHWALGLGLGWLVGPVLWLVGPAIWETIQARKTKDWEDTLEDVAHVGAGALAWISPLTLLVAAPLMGAGILRRYKQREVVA